MKNNKCKVCGRKLKSEKSQERGMGETCWKRYHSIVKYKELFKLSNNNITKEEN
jgi:hypothetical protein